VRAQTSTRRQASLSAVNDQGTRPRPSTTANHLWDRFGSQLRRRSDASCWPGMPITGPALSATNVPLPSITTVGWWRSSMSAFRRAMSSGTSGGQCDCQRWATSGFRSRCCLLNVMRPSSDAVLETITRGRREALCVLMPRPYVHVDHVRQSNLARSGDHIAPCRTRTHTRAAQVVRAGSNCKPGRSGRSQASTRQKAVRCAADGDVSRPPIRTGRAARRACRCRARRRLVICRQGTYAARAGNLLLSAVGRSLFGRLAATFLEVLPARGG